MKAWLDSPWVYELSQSAVTRRNCWSNFVERHVRPVPGSRLLDLGCGTGLVHRFLPPLEYWGLDADCRYIEYAQKKNASGATFICTDLREVWPVEGSFDLVIATGLLHHLPDTDVLETLRRARALLKEKGRCVTFDGCFERRQSSIARWLLSNDRGQYVRFEEEYGTLAHSVFKQVELRMERDFLRLPYSHLVMEMTRD